MKRTLAFFLLLVGPVAADHIHLQSGEVLRGRVLERKGDDVVVRLPFLTITLAAAQVKEVVAEPPEVYVREVAAGLIDDGEPLEARQFLLENRPAVADSEEIGRLALVAEGWATGREATLAMDFDRAAEGFLAALEAAPGNEALASEAARLDETRAFVGTNGYLPGEDRRLETKRFEIVHRHSRKAEALGRALEELLRPVEDELSGGENHQLRLEGRVVVFHCETRERFDAVAGAEHAGRTAAVLSPYRLALWIGASDDELRPLATRLVARHLYPALPPWAEEGMVAGAMARKPADVYGPLRDAYRDGKALSIEDLLLVRDPTSLDDRAELFRLQSRALVDLLVHEKGSKAKLRQVFKDAQAAVARRLNEMLRSKGPGEKVEGGRGFGNLAREAAVPALKERYRYDDLAELEADIQKFLGVAGKGR